MKKGQFSKLTLIGMFTFLLAFVIVCLVLFGRTGNEPATLITCVFGFCGVEGGALAWIKACKVKNPRHKKKMTDTPPEAKPPPTNASAIGFDITPINKETEG